MFWGDVSDQGTRNAGNTCLLYTSIMVTAKTSEIDVVKGLDHEMCIRDRRGSVVGVLCLVGCGIAMADLHQVIVNAFCVAALKKHLSLIHI